MKTPIQIMLVEDNPEYRNVLKVAINRTPEMELVGTVGTAERAMQKLDPAEKTQAPDLILLDLVLPGLSGLDVIPWFKTNVPDTKIIILTQSENEADILLAITLGISGYLLKSSTIQQIKDGIHTVMNGGASLDPITAKFILSTLKKNSKTVHTDIPLTEREHEILGLLSQGLSKKEISTKLNISFFTVSTHIRHIYQKLEVPNAPAAVATALRKGWL
ncbi:response regulator [Rubritalea spongiae]|uniref:Response regulator n=1 Tax=Rubritalea spongiae TaxID=430797 RepID=A0ABW5E1F4_9BACT